MTVFIIIVGLVGSMSFELLSRLGDCFLMSL
jgi:hypothetical protein